MDLFHATYRANQESIRAFGLLCSPGQAVSFAECSDDVPESWLNEIVVHTVNSEILDASLFSLDSNILDSTRLTSYQYEGNIPPSAITSGLKENNVIQREGRHMARHLKKGQEIVGWHDGIAHLAVTGDIVLW